MKGTGKKVFSGFWEGRRRREGKLIYEYLLVLAAITAILVVSFGLTSYIARYSAMEEALQAADVIFEQAADRMELFEEDIDSLYMNVVYNPSVSGFLSAAGLPGRWENMDNFQQMVGNNMRINRSLENVSLYNTRGELIAAKGDVFYPWGETEPPGGETVYSDRIVDGKTGEIYFQVGMTIYEEREGDGFVQNGFVSLLFRTDSLQEIVDGALLNPESGVAILDRHGSVVVSAGKWRDSYRWETRTSDKGTDLVYVNPVGDTGWRLMSVVPRSSMTSGVTQMQRIIYTTYLIVFGAMVLVCFLVYNGIIRPISRQTAFMAGFTKDTGRRIEVTQNNEIGELARKMNQMLDDIEELNGRIMDSQKKLLELEYAKKQTEMIAYRSQMNPHFLSNTFNCIRGMALAQGERDIAELTLSLSSFFRYSINGAELVTVQEALDNLQHYARIIQYRFNGKHQVLVNAARQVFPMKIPKMLIQPLVENAVLHGLETKLGNGRVYVRITLEEKGNALENGTYGLPSRRLVVMVEDNGGGIGEETLRSLKEAMEQYDRNGTIPDKKHGIGVLNAYRRLRLFYGEQAEFEITGRAGEGTCVRLAFPVKEQEEQNVSGISGGR
ncbi:MAG TPA: sensor histidine kinase [Candidatus Eisenbergiella intestinipullorum]|nr:sensor histidine kinase [Candidatus Eisenbergiella intestinipullorum]